MIVFFMLDSLFANHRDQRFRDERTVHTMKKMIDRIVAMPNEMSNANHHLIFSAKRVMHAATRKTIMAKQTVNNSSNGILSLSLFF